GTADHRSDQFAFGAVLYEMLIGTNPFRKQTVAESWSALCDFDPERLDGRISGAPPHFASALARCLAKNPASRFTSPRELEEQLKLEAKPRRARDALILAVTAMLALAAGGTWWGMRQARAKAAAPPVVAVRSFKYISSDQAHEYLSSGMSEELR